MPPPLLAAAFLALSCVAAQAAGGPFGVATPDTPAATSFAGPFSGLVAWSAAWQSTFYRELTAALRSVAADPAAGWLLVGLSFLYGVFHAVGPGHGKAVVTSYLLATGETLRRGIVISFAAALLQAASAIAIVTIFTVLLGVTAMTIGRVTDGIEVASYALITLLGLVLLWRKAMRPALAAAVPLSAAVAVPQGHHGHAHGAAGHHGHDEACGCGHDHVADPATLAGPFDWRRAAAAVTAVGIRPCSGALIVLVFALSQGLFAHGVAATLAMALGTGLTVSLLAATAVFARGAARRFLGEGSRLLPRLMRGVEIAAALVIVLFGGLMLAGALAAGGHA